MNVDFAREYQKRIPFIQHLRIHTEALGQGSARLSLPVETHLTNSMGKVHGGVIMSLLDVALCTAARTLPQPELRRGRGERRGRHARRQGGGHGARDPEGEKIMSNFVSHGRGVPAGNGWNWVASA